MNARVGAGLLSFLLCLSIVFRVNMVSADTLDCYQVDGLAIFGYKNSEWMFIGAIASKFNSDSIANEFGAGSKFDSNSIFNQFGTFGSEFSSASAFNEFASQPPILVNNSYKFVGYLTLNEFKTPNINTYEAIACSNKSFSSPSRDMEDITFKNIPTSAQTSVPPVPTSSPTPAPAPSPSSYPTPYQTSTLPPSAPVSCGRHTSLVDGACKCDLGYLPPLIQKQTFDCWRPLKCQENASIVNLACQCNPGYVAKLVSLTGENNVICVAVSPPPQTVASQPTLPAHQTPSQAPARVVVQEKEKASVSVNATSTNTATKFAWFLRLWRFLLRID